MSELADSNISLVNNVFIKQMVFVKKGSWAVTHAHTYDHQTLLASGRLRMTLDGQTTELTGPCIIVIQAGKHHAFEALEDGTVAYCIHAIKNGETIDEADPLVQGQANREVTTCHC